MRLIVQTYLNDRNLPPAERFYDQIIVNVSLVTIVVTIARSIILSMNFPEQTRRKPNRKKTSEAE